MRAVLQPSVGGIVSAAATGIFVSSEASEGWEPLARLTGNAPGLPGVTFSALGDPVLANDATNNGGLAFSGTLKGTGVLAANDASLWWQPKGGVVTLLAREGSQAPGCPSGASFKAFTSLAYAGGNSGPLFLGTLALGGGGVTSVNDIGVWGVDSTGALRLLFREGDSVQGKTLNLFNVLKSTVGSVGVTRAFNSQGQVTWLATFTDNTTSVMTTQVP